VVNNFITQLVVTLYGKEGNSMNETLARMVLETGRTDKEFAEMINEINLRSTLAVIYYTGTITTFETRLFGNRIVIMLADGRTIDEDFNKYCSDVWKNKMLRNRKLPKDLENYNEEWEKKERFNIVFKLAVVIILLTVCLTFVIISSMMREINSANIFALVVLVVGYFKVITETIHNFAEFNITRFMVKVINKSINVKEESINE